MNTARTKINLKVTPLSGFDKSHYHDLTANVGSLVPVMTDEVIPGFVNLNVAASVQLPPLASDTFMKTDLKLEAFFCPSRLLYGGFEKFFADDAILMYNYNDSVTEELPCIPTLSIGSGWESVPSQFAHGSLFDYLGFSPNAGWHANCRCNMLSALCYHKIYDDWYRAPLVQQQLFSDGLVTADEEGPMIGVANMPYLCLDANHYVFGLSSSDTEDDLTKLTFINGDTLFTLHQRNYGFDYFTNAWPKLQFGSMMTVATDSAGKFTIAALRAANSFQIFSERNNLSPRYYQAVKQRYGFEPSSMDVNRPVFLGSASIPIVSYGVDVTAANNTNQSPQGDISSNPFAYNAGAQLGRAVGRGSVNLIDNFKVNEPGFIMVIASVVPRAVYSSATERRLTRYIAGEGSIVDMANPILQNTGNQPIYQYELEGNGIGNYTHVFGYTDRYADWFTKFDRVSGLLHDGESLSAFALKRSFSSSAVLNSNFLKIPVSALDEVSATDEYISSYGAWMQFGFDYKVAMPMALYSIPSLQDPAYEHGTNVEVYRGGFRF